MALTLLPLIDHVIAHHQRYPVSIEAGQNAGAWTVAITKTGNALGLSREEVEQLAPSDLQARLATASAEFQRLGATFCH